MVQIKWDGWDASQHWHIHVIRDAMEVLVQMGKKNTDHNNVRFPGSASCHRKDRNVMNMDVLGWPVNYQHDNVRQMLRQLMSHAALFYVSSHNVMMCFMTVMINTPCFIFNKCSDMSWPSTLWCFTLYVLYIFFLEGEGYDIYDKIWSWELIPQFVLSWKHRGIRHSFSHLNDRFITVWRHSVFHFSQALRHAIHATLKLSNLSQCERY